MCQHPFIHGSSLLLLKETARHGAPQTSWIPQRRAINSPRSAVTWSGFIGGARGAPRRNHTGWQAVSRGDQAMWISTSEVTGSQNV